MHDSQFRELERRLLRGGVAPKHVKRTIQELRHHFGDLEAKALSEGISAEDAAARAAKQLGDEDLILKEVLARPELKSWAHRWAWAIYGFGPMGMFVLAFVASAALIITLLSTAEANSGLGRPAFHAQWWVRVLFEAWRLFIMYVLSTVLAVGLCLFAAGREARNVWPIIGVILVAFLGCSLRLHIEWPGSPEELVNFSWMVGFKPSDPLASIAIRLFIPVIVALGPYLWWRRLLQRENSLN